MKYSRSEVIWGYALTAPTVLLSLVFVIGPMLGAIYLSLTQYDLLSSPRFVGLANYRGILIDKTFWTVTFNTLTYLIGVPIGILLALVLAVSLNDRQLRGGAIYRMIYFLPLVVPLVAVGAVWAWLYNYDYGLINHILRAVGLQGVNWLGSYQWSKAAVIITGVWGGFGGSTIVLLGGLQGIPDDVIDAAKIDGATGLALHRCITVPLLAPSLVFVNIVSFIASFQIFDLVMVLTGGGPGRSSASIVQYIYETAFNTFNMGLASAMAFVLFLVLLALSVVQFYVSQRWVYD